MKSLLIFMKENNGQLSSIRLFSMVAVFCMATDWIHAVFTTGKWSPDIELIALVLGIISAKVVQKPFEIKEVDKPVGE